MESAGVSKFRSVPTSDHYLLREKTTRLPQHVTAAPKTTTFDSFHTSTRSRLKDLEKYLPGGEQDQTSSVKPTQIDILA